MICIVLKPFASDRPHAAGDLVDTSGWRWTDRLIAQRYLRAANSDEAVSARRTATAAAPPTVAAKSKTTKRRAA